MANEFEAKVDIDTTQAAAGLKAVDKSVADLDKTIKSLDGSLKSMQSSLSATARAMQDANKAQRESAVAADKSAAAAIKSARARELDSKAALNNARTESLQRREREATNRANDATANSFQAVTGAVRGYTAGTQEAANANAALSGSMSNTRYLLYDIGATYSAISIALLALPTATTAVATSFEKDFAQVQRTTLETGASAQELKADLMALATEIPLAFGDLTKIASLGAQLGVPTESLAAFTDVVAKFSASTGVAAEEAGAAFGRIGSSFGLGADEYNNLGSAIAKVGVSSAATETEIIAISQQLAPLASLAGFSAQEVVGLSGALASMRIRPELARGAFQSTIFKITEATEAGGKSLKAYADVMGITGEQVKTLFKTNPAQFFQDYITGIGKAMEGGQSFSSILDTLGVKEKRERQFILAMANQYGFLGDQIKLANSAYAEGTFLDESSAIVFQTLAANLQKLGNSLANFGAVLGGSSLGPLSKLVGLLADGTVAVTDFVKSTPFLKEILGVLLGFGAVAGVFFAVRSAMAFVLAALVGFQQVASKTAIATTFSLKGIAAQAVVTRLVTQGATAQMAGDYVRSAGIIRAASAQVVAANGSVAASITSTGGKFRGFAAMAIGAVGGLPGIIIGALTAIGLGFIDAQQKAEAAGKSIAEAMKIGGAEGLKATAEALKEIKVSIGSGLEMGNLNKDLTQISGEAGIGFEKLVASVSKGKAGIAEFNRAVDAVAQSQGYKDLQDMAQNNPFKWTEEGQQVAKLDFLKRKVAEIAGENDKSTQSAKTADDAIKKLGAEGAEAMVALEGDTEGASSAFDKLDENIRDAVAQIFGLQNAESAASAALYKLGQSLAESRDFTIGTEGGRENLSAAQDAVTKYAQSLAQAQADGVLTAQQAAADYAAFIDGLFNELVTRGVDPVQAAQFVEMAKGVMQAQASSGTPVTVPVAVDPVQAQGEALTAAGAVQAVLDSVNPEIRLSSNHSHLKAELEDIAGSLSVITGEPYHVVLDALTDPANEKAAEMQQYIVDIVNGKYVAPINSDTSAAIANVQNFATFAQQQLAAIQASYNAVAASAPTFAKYAKGAFKGVTGVTNSAPESIRRPEAPTISAPVQRIAAPAQVGATAAPARALGNLGQGYDNVADKARKAGAAGNKAGKDAANGINEAAEAVNDYADRLRTGLTAAFDRQYGLQKATDEYYTQLNTINKRRQDELKTIADLVAKQKELNNARKGDLIAARKAQIEAAISDKYGEVDRAADYRQQAEEARLSAAEKQRNIDTALKEQQTLQAGIGKLTGYSQAAIDNREALRSLEAKSLDMVAAYAATGVSTDRVRAYAASLNLQWQRDVRQMGYNMGSVRNLTGSFQRYIAVINAVPRVKPTTVSANVGSGGVGGGGTGAIGAVNAFNRAADYAARNRTTILNAKLTPFAESEIRRLEKAGDMLGANSRRTANRYLSGNAYNTYATGGLVEGYASGGLIPGTPPSNPNVDNRMAKVDGKRNIMVRSGEYILSEPAVKRFGVDYLDAMNNLRIPRYNVGGAVPGSVPSSTGNIDNGPLLVELTPDNIRAILRLADRPVDLYAGVEKLASTVAEGNAILASKGVSN